MPTKSTYPLLESIALIDGHTPLLPYHQERVNRAFSELYPHQNSLCLQSILNRFTLPQKGTYKIRLLYNSTDYQVEWTQYKRQTIRSIAVQEIPSDFSYEHKFTNRDSLTKLRQKHLEDEVLFFRDHYLTDAYYFNVLVAKNGQLWTPKTPLLKGCMRAYLLERKKIQKAEIDRHFIAQSDGILLINALNPIKSCPYIPVQRIHFNF